MPASAAEMVGAISERDLIARLRARVPAAADWLIVGIGDDAAVVAPERNALEVVTTDVCVEGVHFDRRFVPPDAVGHRALAMNLSDLAAMGAAPRFATLSLAFPPDLPLADFDALLDGWLALAARHRLHLAGGNLSRSPGPLFVDVTANGSVKPRKVLRRAGARPGDFVYVSGAIGRGRSGLQRLQGSASAEGSDVSWYLRPEPRVRLGMLLGRMQAATACMDLSDGLADGLAQMAEAGGVGIDVDADALPIDDAARDWMRSRNEDPVRAAVAGGDDYELLFTVSPKRGGRLRAVTRLARGLPVTKIGRVTRETGVRILRGGTTEPLPAGFSHFGAEAPAC